MKNKYSLLDVIKFKFWLPNGFDNECVWEIKEIVSMNIKNGKIYISNHQDEHTTQVDTIDKTIGSSFSVYINLNKGKVYIDGVCLTKFKCDGDINMEINKRMCITI